MKLAHKLLNLRWIIGVTVVLGTIPRPTLADAKGAVSTPVATAHADGNPNETSSREIRKYSKAERDAILKTLQRLRLKDLSYSTKTREGLTKCSTRVIKETSASDGLNVTSGETKVESKAAWKTYFAKTAQDCCRLAIAKERTGDWSPKQGAKKEFVRSKVEWNFSNGTLFNSTGYVTSYTNFSCRPPSGNSDSIEHTDGGFLRAIYGDGRGVATVSGFAWSMREEFWSLVRKVEDQKALLLKKGLLPESDATIVKLSERKDAVYKAYVAFTVEAFGVSYFTEPDY